LFSGPQWLVAKTLAFLVYRKGQKDPVEVVADTPPSMADDPLVFRIATRQVAQFKNTEVQGWTVAPEEKESVADILRKREAAQRKAVPIKLHF
jgi:hypothetical protein